VLRSSLVVAALGGLVATGVAALPAQAGGIASAGNRGGVNMTSTAHLPAALAAITAASHRLGTLTGVVVGLDGRPLSGACVTATGAAGTATTMTRNDGRYVLAGLRPGRYALRYAACPPRAAIIPARRFEPRISSSASSDSHNGQRHGGWRGQEPTHDDAGGRWPGVSW
jgi:hypothetical protein